MISGLPPSVPLAALRGFDAFGQTGSIKSAGEKLAISPTVVSRHIQNLESVLGIRLVTPQGRRIVLTEQGQVYFKEIRRAFDIIEAANAAIAQPATVVPLHICCPPGLATRRLLARLPELEGRLGGRRVTLQPTLTTPNLKDPKIDAALVYIDAIRPVFEDEWVAEPIFQPRILAVCSPTFKAKHPQVTSVRDLVNLPLLCEQTPDDWESWFLRCGVDAPRLPNLRRLWNSQLTIEAARLDQGIALVSELLAGPDEKESGVVEIVPSAVFLGSYYFLAKKAERNTEHLEAVRAWIGMICSDDAFSRLCVAD